MSEFDAKYIQLPVHVTLLFDGNDAIAGGIIMRVLNENLKFLGKKRIDIELTQAEQATLKARIGKRVQDIVDDTGWEPIDPSDEVWAQ
jgi:hypothetical protein